MNQGLALVRRGRTDFNVYFLIIIVLVLYSLFGGVLFTEIQEQEIKIGDKHKNIFESQDRLAFLKLQFDRQVPVPVRQAIQQTIRNAGLAETECGKSGSYVYWNTPNKSCVANDPYSVLYENLRHHTKQELSNFDSAQGTRTADMEYEFYADSGRIVGIPDRYHAIPIQSTGSEEQVLTFLGIEYDRIPEGVRNNIGWHYWSPVIDVNVKSGIEDYVKVRELYGAVTSFCEFKNRANQTKCISEQANIRSMNVSVQEAADNYYLLTIPSSAKIVESTLNYRIGVYLRPLRVTLNNGTTTSA